MHLIWKLHHILKRIFKMISHYGEIQFEITGHKLFASSKSVYILHHSVQHKFRQVQFRFTLSDNVSPIVSDESFINFFNLHVDAWIFTRIRTQKVLRGHIERYCWRWTLQYECRTSIPSIWSDWGIWPSETKYNIYPLKGIVIYFIKLNLKQDLHNNFWIKFDFYKFVEEKL